MLLTWERFSGAHKPGCYRTNGELTLRYGGPLCATSAGRAYWTFYEGDGVISLFGNEVLARENSMCRNIASGDAADDITVSGPKSKRRI